MTDVWREPAAWRPTSELDAATVLRTLVERGVDFVVVGGFAVMFHGHVRATKDVDIVPRPDRDNYRLLFTALERLAARPIEVGDFRPDEPPVPFSPEGLGEGGNWALGTDAGRVDVLQWIAGVDGYRQLREHAVEANLPGIGQVSFAGYDDLVAMKRAAGRAADEVDLRVLERLRAGRE
ncbi:MAG: hypothetical protein ICV64_02620 [Thermoleophilia bacterium]|nr:hypothetical protein [Thermoleophilia bacterium]